MGPYHRCPTFFSLCVISTLFVGSLAHEYQQAYGVPQQQQQVYHQQPPVQQQGYQQPIQYQQQPPQQQQQFQQQHHVPQQQQPQPGQVPHYQEAPAVGTNLLHDASRIHDTQHVKEHLHEEIGGDQDVSKMTEEELQFHYFKMHDNDHNNMLDGLELIKSLIHWHVEEGKQVDTHQQQGGQSPQAQHQQGPPGEHPPHPDHTKLFSDHELTELIDPILQNDDKNGDGFIDYPEFIAAQKNRGL